VNKESSSAATERQSPGGTLKDEPLDKLKIDLGFSSGGLSQEEAPTRLDRYGYNELVEKRVNPLFKFLTYFWRPIPVMIMVAAYRLFGREHSGLLVKQASS